MQYLDELKALNFPTNQFAIFGSGPMAIRNIRENNNVDVIVTPELWNKLAKERKLGDAHSFTVGHIDVWKDWTPWFDDVKSLIKHADVIDGVRYVKLKYVVEWKTMRNAQKDIDDLDKLRMYMDFYGDGTTQVFK